MTFEKRGRRGPRRAVPPDHVDERALNGDEDEERDRPHDHCEVADGFGGRPHARSLGRVSAHANTNRPAVEGGPAREGMR